MLEKYPSLKAYFHALEVYMLGDLQVFDKNCDEADRSDGYHRTSISGRPMTSLWPDQDIPYSSIYPKNMGSNPSTGYINNPFPRLTIPLALTLFSAIEFLGILYTGRTDPGSTTKNIGTFFEKLEPADRPSSDDIRRLIKIYRHGLVHQYFAKNGALLSYRQFANHSLFEMNETLCLNVNYLKRLFISGFEKIRNDEASYAVMETNIVKLNQAAENY